MIKDLFAIVDHGEKSKPFLDAAVTLGEAHDACLEVGVLTGPPLAATTLAPFFEIYLPETVLAERAAERVEEVRLRLAHARCPVSVVEFLDDVLWLAGDLRRSRQIADLLLVGPSSGWEIPWLRGRIIETMLLAASTPLILLPEDRGLRRIRRAVIGWKPSREAVRAVHDLVALAEPGVHIDVVVIGDAGQPGDSDARAGAEVKRHLERHGLSAKLHWLHSVSVGEADLLQEFAVETDADVLAIGGFAHSRIREVLLGGVTRALVRENRVPLLLAH